MTALEQAALILQCEASNPGVLTGESIAATLGFDPKRSAGIVCAALMCSPSWVEDVRLWFGEAEARVRCLIARGEGSL